MKLPAMMQHPNAVCLAALLACVSGCASEPPVAPRLYVLSAPRQDAAGLPAPSRQFAVAVGPVSVPDYLDQPLLVTRTGDNALSLIDQGRWAMPLASNITEVVIEGLSQYLATERVAAFPGSAGFRFDYRVVIEIVSFEGAPGKTVELLARWRVMDAIEKRALLERRTRHQVPVDGNDLLALVEAQSGALLLLTRDIGDGLIALAGKPSESQPASGP